MPIISTQVKVVLFIALGTVIFVQYQMISGANETIAMLEAANKTALSANTSLSKEIQTLTTERDDARKDLEDFSARKQRRQESTIETVTVIKEAIKHEKCADTAIPNVDSFVYYD